jgi:hypothetical protein
MRAAILSLLVLFSLSAAAQPGVESVTVVGARSRAAVEQFVQTFAAPSRLAGKLTRWQDGVCPRTLGLKSDFTAFITRRIRDVAAQVGAPVDPHDNCKANIEIVFTEAPQAFIDSIRKDKPALLGYHDSVAALDEAVRMTHPIQAWYLTQTVDLHGNAELDVSRAAGPGFKIDLGPAKPPLWVPSARVMDVTGNRLGDGLRSTFSHVLIVVDPATLKAYEMGALADYIAMLSLTQLATQDACQQLPSIVNLLAPGCTPKPNALGAGDLGYLRGLYKMSPGSTLRVQQNEVIYQMQNAPAQK